MSSYSGRQGLFQLELLQAMRIPSFLEIHHLFREGEYDRLMCSTEGPKDIIEHNVNGFLAKTKSDIVRYATDYLQSASSHQPFRIAAMKRAARYKPHDIINDLLINTGFNLDEVSAG